KPDPSPRPRLQHRRIAEAERTQQRSEPVPAGRRTEQRVEGRGRACHAGNETTARGAEPWRFGTDRPHYATPVTLSPPARRGMDEAARSPRARPARPPRAPLAPPSFPPTAGTARIHAGRAPRPEG